MVGTLRTKQTDVMSATLIALWDHLSFRSLTIPYIKKSAAVKSTYLKAILIAFSVQVHILMRICCQYHQGYRSKNLCDITPVSNKHISMVFKMLCYFRISWKQIISFGLIYPQILPYNSLQTFTNSKFHSLSVPLLK